MRKTVEHYILSEDSFYRLLGEDTHYKVIRKYRGEELVGIKYEPLLDFRSGRERI